MGKTDKSAGTLWTSLHPTPTPPNPHPPTEQAGGRASVFSWLTNPPLQVSAQILLFSSQALQGAFDGEPFNPISLILFVGGFDKCLTYMSTCSSSYFLTRSPAQLSSAKPPEQAVEMYKYRCRAASSLNLNVHSWINVPTSEWKPLLKTLQASCKVWIKACFSVRFQRK